MSRALAVVSPPLFALAAGVAAFALALAFPGGDDNTPPPAGEASHPIAFYDARTFDDSLMQAERVPVSPMPGVRALIVPHHWVGGYLILRGIRDLAASGDFTRVILVGPDHVGASSATVATSDLSWSTPYGRLQADTASIDRLISLGLAKADPDVLTHEHSVAGIVHAIEYYMPAVKVVPLVLRHDMSFTAVRSLAGELAQLSDEHTALIAAVDFSHYLSAPEASAKDAETIVALEGMDSQRIMTYRDDHLDSPPSIALAIELSRILGADHFVLRENTNSGAVTGTLAPPVTSYVASAYVSP